MLTIPRECLLGHDLVYVRRKANATCESRVDEEVRRLERVCAGMTLRTASTRTTRAANRTDSPLASHTSLPFDTSRINKIVRFVPVADIRRGAAAGPVRPAAPVSPAPVSPSTQRTGPDPGRI